MALILDNLNNLINIDKNKISAITDIWYNQTYFYYAFKIYYYNETTRMFEFYIKNYDKNKEVTERQITIFRNSLIKILIDDIGEDIIKPLTTINLKK